MVSRFAQLEVPPPMLFSQTIKLRGPLRRSCLPGIAAKLLVLSAVISSSRAAAITYVATNVADTMPGQDLWEDSYRISLDSFASGEGFTVNFDRNFYALLQSPPPIVNADWDAITIQPDLPLHSDGFYDALALRNAPSLADPFTVRFVWLGRGAPGAQPFTVHDRNFATVSQGQTAAVPEPSARLFMFCIPVAVLLSRRASHSRRSTAVAR